MASKKRPGHRSPEARGPSIRELRKIAGQTGDVDALWNELTTRHFSMVDQEEIFGHLLRAIEVRSREGPEAFAGDTFARMIGFISYLTLRAAFYLNHRVSRHGRATCDHGPADFPPEVADKLIPRLMDLQGHLSELMQAQAVTARSWQLILAKRIENDRAVGSGGKAKGARRSRKVQASANGHTKPPNAPGAKPRKASAKHKSNGKSNGHQEPAILDAGPINRIGRYLNGDASGVNGVGHDD